MLSSYNDEEIVLREKYMIMLDEILLFILLLVLKMKIETCGLFLYLNTFLCMSDFL